MNDDWPMLPLLPEPDTLLDASFPPSISPGDVALFSVDHDVTREQVAEIRAHLVAKMPGVDVVVLSHVHFEATYRPAADA
jgi:hypothetical protein